MEWRKVLVTLRPDAHNNIAVRRKFSNAFGWGVIDHLVENHFGEEAIEREIKFMDNVQAKVKQTVVKLVSTAFTGFCRQVSVARGAPIVKQVRYDPIGMLFGGCVARLIDLLTQSI
ncbi:unnamed protein product [Wickerhamomyces anomalus]